jgi:transposase
LNGILWVLRTGAPWADLPDRYPSYQTCHRRFQQWVRSGIMKHALESLAADLRLRCDLDLREAFIDATFAPAKKGGPCVGKTKRGKGTKIMAVADRHGLPVAVSIASASPHEVTLVQQTLAEMIVPDNPVHLIGDNAYDSDKLDAILAPWGIEMIAPHHSNRRNSTQDGRALRRNRRRWKIERLFAWLHNFRRLIVRYEYRAENFLGMIHLAVAFILIRRLL